MHAAIIAGTAAPGGLLVGHHTGGVISHAILPEHPCRHARPDRVAGPAAALSTDLAAVISAPPPSRPAA